MCLSRVRRCVLKFLNVDVDSRTIEAWSWKGCKFLQGPSRLDLEWDWTTSFLHMVANLWALVLVESARIFVALVGFPQLWSWTGLEDFLVSSDCWLSIGLFLNWIGDPSKEEESSLAMVAIGWRCMARFCSSATVPAKMLLKILELFELEQRCRTWIWLKPLRLDYAVLQRKASCYSDLLQLTMLHSSLLVSFAWQKWCVTFYL